MWEVFNARDGVPVFTTRWRTVARVVAMLLGREFDYAKSGEGW